MNIKKAVSILIAVIMIVSLAACGNEASVSGNTGKPAGSAGTAAQEPAGKTETAQEPAANTGTAVQEPAGNNTETADAPKENGTENTEPEKPAEPEGSVVLDNDYFKLTFKGIEEDKAPFFCRMLFNVETKSSEENLQFYGELMELAINGYGIYEYAQESFVVEFISDSDFEIRLYDCVLKAIGVDSIDKIEKVDILLSDWPLEDGKYTHKFYGDCSIYPTGLEGSYVRKEREDMPGDETVDGQNFRVTLYWEEGIDFITALSSDGEHSPVVIIENKTDNEYHLSCWDFLVNGVRDEAHSGSGEVGGNIKPGGMLVGRLQADNYVRTLQRNNVTKVDSITYQLSVYAVNDHPYNLGDTLGKFNITVEPDDIHK